MLLNIGQWYRKMVAKILVVIIALCCSWGTVGKVWANDYFRGKVEIKPLATNPGEKKAFLSIDGESYQLEFNSGVNFEKFDQKVVIIKGIKFEEDVGQPNRVKGIDVFKIYLEADANVHVGRLKISNLTDGETPEMSLEMKERGAEGRIRRLILPEGFNDFEPNWNGKMVVVFGQSFFIRISNGELSEAIKIQRMALLEEKENHDQFL